jgi:amino acid transporter
MILFDYIFYRVAKFFYKKDGIDAFTGLCTVGLIQGLTVGVLAFSILRSIYGLSETAKITKGSGLIGVSIGVLFLIFNYLRYKGKYWRFAEKWTDNETQQQKEVRGLLVVMAILLPICLVCWMGTSGYRE